MFSVQLIRMLISSKDIKTTQSLPNICNEPILVLKGKSNYTIQFECNKGDMGSLKVEDVKVFLYPIYKQSEKTNVAFKKPICLEELTDIISIESKDDFHTVIFDLGTRLDTQEIEKQKYTLQSQLQGVQDDLWRLNDIEIQTKTEIKQKSGEYSVLLMDLTETLEKLVNTQNIQKKDNLSTRMESIDEQISSADIRRGILNSQLSEIQKEMVSKTIEFEVVERDSKVLSFQSHLLSQNTAFRFEVTFKAEDNSSVVLHTKYYKIENNELIEVDEADIPYDEESENRHFRFRIAYLYVILLAFSVAVVNTLFIRSLSKN